MSQVQRVIKYVAVAFAIFLIFSIVSGIMYGMISFTNIFDDDDPILENLKELPITNDVLVLNIEVGSANIIIKQGESLKVETNNKYISLKEKGNQLSITEKKHKWISKSNSELVIYVPENYIFDDVNFETGAGKINIDKLSTKSLDFDLGAGEVTIDNLDVTDETSIEGGAGKISILNGSINNLDLDMGVGELSITSRITGNNNINAGVGKMVLNLLGDDYKIKIDKGIGSATVNNEKVVDSSYYGSGRNIIDIDGGVGNIEVSYSR